MSVRIEVKGTKEALDALKRLDAAGNTNVRAAVKKTLIQGEARMKRYVTNPSPSSPGNAPGVDTGRYRASWRNRLLASGGGLHGGEVYTDVEYGPYLEYGTRRMGARPHVGPVSEHIGEDFRHNATEALKALEGGA